MRLSLKAILVVLQWVEFHSCSPRPLGSRTRTAEYQYFGYQNPTFSLRTCARSNREHISGCSRLLVNKIAFFQKPNGLPEFPILWGVGYIHHESMAHRELSGPRRLFGAEWILDRIVCERLSMSICLPPWVSKRHFFASHLRPERRADSKFPIAYTFWSTRMRFSKKG